MHESKGIEEVVRRVFDAFNARKLEARLELFAPDAEVLPVRSLLEDTVYHGHEGVRQFVRDTNASWSERHIALREVEVRDDQALIVGRLRLKGLASDAVAEQDVAWVVSVRDGLVTRLATYQTREAALAELGWER